MGRSRSGRRRLLVSLAAVLAFGLAGAGAAAAGDPPGGPLPAGPSSGPGSPPAMDGAPVPAPVPAPGDAAAGAPGAPGPAAPAGADAAGPSTEAELLALLTKKPAALFSLVLLKFVVAALGLGVIVLLLVRRRDVRRGLVAAPAPRPPAVAPFDGIASLAVLGAWFAAGPLLSLAAARLLGMPGGKPTLVASLVCMCLTSLPIATVVAVVARRRRATVGPAAVPVGEALRVAGGVILVAGAVVLALQVAWALVLQHGFGTVPELQDLVRRVVAPKAPIEPWLITFLGVVVAPFAEEAVFRGTLYPALRGRIGGRWAAVAVSAFFAAIHANALALVPLFGLALLLTWCYERTGSIFAGVVVHAVSNATSLVPLLFL